MKLMETISWTSPNSRRWSERIQNKQTKLFDRSNLMGSFNVCTQDCESAVCKGVVNDGEARGFGDC